MMEIKYRVPRQTFGIFSSSFNDLRELDEDAIPPMAVTFDTKADFVEVTIHDKKVAMLMRLAMSGEMTRVDPDEN
ncbi:hypothetical protein [Azospirillum sp. B4]|uniref:hypothetical protein n=1 Tax=Azospirillum sp. B4 TaxID=95605 RepID=UPI0011DD4BED|nr:hypothetical protein [Azospirillum sp. B4]